MSYKNFVPTIWTGGIEIARKPTLVAVELCNRDYEGLITKLGDKVKINGVARPTVSSFSQSTGLSNPEVLSDQSTTLEITEADSFNFMVGDIDKRQAGGDLMQAELTEASIALGVEQDAFVYSTINSAIGHTATESSLSKDNVFDRISAMLEYLYGHDVPASERVTLEVSPAFARRMMLAQILQNTDNSRVIANGFLEALKLFNVDVYMTNKLYKDSNQYEHIVMRTKKAVSFASQISEIIPYVPEKQFADAVKGLEVYGAKVVRPREIAVLQVQAYASIT